VTSLATLAERYARDGFVHAPGLIPTADVEAAGAAVDEAVARRKVHDERNLDQKTPYEQSFIQCQYLWEDSPGVAPLTFHPALGTALSGTAFILHSGTVHALLIGVFMALTTPVTYVLLVGAARRRRRS
jgi:hypothetical protein